MKNPDRAPESGGGTVPPGPAPAAPSLLPGYLAAAAAVAIWAGWIVATRDQAGGTAPLDVALARYAVPALLLSPVWLRRGFIPKGENLGALLVMTLGWGGPFLVLCTKGLQSAPVAVFAPIIFAGMPLLAALWDRIAGGARFSMRRKAGLALILVSLGLATVPPMLAQAEAAAGLPWIFAAAAGWTAYAVAVRRSTLKGFEAAAYVCAWSTPPLLVAVLVSGAGVGAMAPEKIAWLALSQGVVSGIAAVALFTFSIRRLGADRASSFPALVPAFAAIAAAAALGETLGPLEIAAAVCAGLGVALVNGVFRRRG